jgi:hypothetical protein
VYGEEEICIPLCLGKLEGKKTLGRYKNRREDSIKMDHQ